MAIFAPPELTPALVGQGHQVVPSESDLPADDSPRWVDKAEHPRIQ